MWNGRLIKATVLSSLGLALGLLLTMPGSAADVSDVLDSSYLDEVSMIKGEIISVKVNALTRVSITNPAVADIVDATDKEILLVGQAKGRTVLFIWDDYGKRTVMVYVYAQDLDIVKSRMEKVLKIAGVHEVKLSINEQEGKIYITGTVPAHKKGKFNEVLGPFSSHFVDLSAKEVINDLVQIDLQITELSETLSESFGIDWATGGISGFAPQYSETVPTFDGSVGDWFKIGDFTRSGQITAAVQALVTSGKGRVLSKPKLVTLSGEAASFLVGGEVPIRTTTFSDSGSSQENISFKSFGISMSVTPTIKREKIDVTMNLEVSEIDASTATTVSSDVAFSTRSASTRLLLDNGQTMILAGLIKHLESETQSKVPFLGDIPIVGLIFRSKVNPIPEYDQELVISLTPHIIRQTKPTDEEDASTQGAEGISWQAPGEGELVRTKAASYYLGIPKEMTGYVSGVQQKISQSIMYPQEARRNGWEGTVKLGVLILNDGTLAFALVKESSGHEVFDEVALSTAKRLAPFSAFPSDTDLQELNMTIPIVYSLSQR